MRMRISALLLALAATLVCAGAGLTDAGEVPTVTVYVDQQRYQISSAAATVGDLLKDLGIKLGDLDRTDPSPKHALTDGAVIRVSRVTCRRVIEEAKLEAKTILLPVTGRPTGFTQILHEGKDGRVRRTLEIWEKDGQVSRREVIAEKVLQPVLDRVVMRSVPKNSSRGAGGYVKPRRMRATAYDPSPRCCGPRATGRTACGTKACKGVVAVDPRVIPFGTRLYIPGYGFAVAEDKGSAIKGDRIDLCFDSYDEAVHYGCRIVDVYILPPSVRIGRFELEESRTVK